MVYALDKKSGQLLWQHKIANCLVTAVQPLDDHTLLAASMDGRLVCLSF